MHYLLAVQWPRSLIFFFCKFEAYLKNCIYNLVYFRWCCCFIFFLSNSYHPLSDWVTRVTNRFWHIGENSLISVSAALKPFSRNPSFFFCNVSAPQWLKVFLILPCIRVPMFGSHTDRTDIKHYPKIISEVSPKMCFKDRPVCV